MAALVSSNLFCSTLISRGIGQIGTGEEPGPDSSDTGKAKMKTGIDNIVQVLRYIEQTCRDLLRDSIREAKLCVHCEARGSPPFQ
jgi:hypothetical protein